MGFKLFLFNLQCAIICVSFMFSLVLFIRSNTTAYFKGLFLYCFFAFLLAILSFIETNFYGIRYAAILLNFSLIIQLILLGNFILSALNSERLRKTLRIFLVIFVLILIVIIFQNKLTSMNSKAYSFSDLCLIIFAIFYYLQLFKDPPSQKLNDQPSFWIITGIFVGMGINTPLASFADYFKIHNSIIDDFFFYLIMINGYLIMHFFFIKGFLCLMRTNKI